MTLKLLSIPFFVVSLAVLSSCASNDVERGDGSVSGTDTMQVADTPVGILDSVSGTDGVVVSSDTDIQGEAGLGSGTAGTDSSAQGGADELEDTELPEDIGIAADSRAVSDDTTSGLDTFDTASLDDTQTALDASEPVDVSLDSGDPEPDVPPTVACTATATMVTPVGNEFFVVGQGIPVTATVTDPAGGALTAFQVEWRDFSDILLATSTVDGSGQTAAILTGVQKGLQDVRIQVRDANGPCDGESLHPILVCTANVVEDFNASLAAPWVIFGDASWSSGGYIEMTGILQGKKGAVYNTAEYVFPGSVSIRFDVLTGGGSGSGADGFAMTIVETDDTSDLPTLLNAAKSGGGLAYASQGSYGNPVEFEAFTVEIDTWHNVYNGNNEFHTDPTQDDHVELTLNLDAGNSIAYTSAGEIEDQAWHTIRVDVVGTEVKVWLDGVLKVEQDVPALNFRGGYIVFSGSTGYYTNYHRFENLEIIHDCKAAPDSGNQ